jgi:hypothetical protein
VATERGTNLVSPLGPQSEALGDELLPELAVARIPLHHRPAPGGHPRSGQYGGWYGTRAHEAAGGPHLVKASTAFSCRTQFHKDVIE